MGFVVAANPLGQMLFSPLVGWWANRLGSIRTPLLTSLATFMFFSVIYSSLELFDDYRKYLMLFSRFAVGASSASIAACRSYLSAATRLCERTQAVSMIALAQILGFMIGPALQAVVVFLGDSGVWLIPGKLKLNMYTAAGWICVLLSIANFILFFPQFFKEHKISVREAMLEQGKNVEKETWKSKKIDYLAAWTLLVAFFGIVFNLMILETLCTPLIMDQFACSKENALYYMGILMTVGAVISCIAFMIISPLCKHFQEAKVMLWGGFLFVLLGRIFYIPCGNTTPKMYNDLITSCQMIKHNERNDTNYLNITVSPLNGTYECNNETDTMMGCPSSQKWCTYTPVMTVWQFVIGYLIGALGYPVGTTLILSIFSKILGSRPQGVWMGLMMGSGSLSRALGPVFVTYVYTKFGTIWTFSITIAMMIFIIVCIYMCLNRFVPFDDKQRNDKPSQELKALNEVSVEQ
ncbi:hypothetical protein FQR65_LT08205 [Abscondita terminalis]|nr:hypothetical protein FQR65_LT08205 [Abscondita terminalis]